MAIAAHHGVGEDAATCSVDEFRAVALPLYRRDPVAHTVELTVLNAGELPDDSY